MNLIGKKLKSKINGKLLLVKSMLTDGGRDHYEIAEIGTNKSVTVERGWFENGIMQNLEILEEGT